MAPEIWSDTATIVCHFGPFFALLCLQFAKSKLWKNEKTAGDIISLHKCTINDNHIMHGFSDMEHDRHNFFTFSTIFYPFSPLTTPKIKTFKELKKWPGDIILHICTINDNHMMYSSWDMEHDRGNFLSLFFAVLPPKNLKNQNFENMKDTPGDIIILHICTINDNHVMYGS